MKAALTTIAILLGIIITSSSIHDLLNSGLPSSKVQFFVAIFLFIIDILIVTGVIYVRNEILDKIEKMYIKTQGEYRECIQSEISIIKIYIDETKNDMSEVKSAIEAALLDIKTIAINTNKRIDALYDAKFNKLSS
jgi:hypothetical protein